MELNTKEIEIINFIRNFYFEDYALHTLSTIVELVQHSPNNEEIWKGRILALKNFFNSQMITNLETYHQPDPMTIKLSDSEIYTITN